MPNRILREGILDSEMVNSLSWSGEVFYRRLMSVVDDFGRFDAREDILRSKLYPLKLDVVSKADVGKWLTECVKAGLVSCYTVSGKNYVLILNFNQQVRIKKGKFPAPPAHDMQMHSTCIADDTHVLSVCMSESKPNQYETETEDEKPPPPRMDGLMAIDLLKEKVIRNGYFYEPICMQSKISKKALHEWLENFNQFLKSDGQHVKTESDYCKHFRNWFRFQENKDKPELWLLVKGDISQKSETQVTLSVGEKFKQLAKKQLELHGATR